jgi:hypothetical protein
MNNCDFKSNNDNYRKDVRKNISQEKKSLECKVILRDTKFSKK